jgi:hypothetical protein
VRVKGLALHCPWISSSFLSTREWAVVFEEDDSSNIIFFDQVSKRHVDVWGSVRVMSSLTLITSRSLLKLNGVTMMHAYSSHPMISLVKTLSNSAQINNYRCQNRDQGNRLGE